MSEKRFTGKLLTNSNGEEFGFTIYDKDKRMNIDEVVEKLNEQQADLNYLAKFIGEFKVEEFKLKLKNLRILEDKVLEQQDIIRKLQDLCGQSDSENARLRMENKILYDEIKLLKPTNIEQYEQIVQLQEENEELRFALRAEQALAKIQSIK